MRSRLVPASRASVRALLGLLFCAICLGASSHRALARQTETLPKNTFLLDVTYSYSWVTQGFDNQSRRAPLIEPLYRYEPGGGLQGIIIPNARVNFQVLVPSIKYGILDYLTVAFAAPVVLHTEVQPRLGWISGDYYWSLGRSYSAEDFWAWAESMGQERPGVWVGNKGVLSDLVLGARYRFSHHIPALERAGWLFALTVHATIPTGRQKDPEEVASAGTTSWELHFQGDLGFHLSMDRVFRSLKSRLNLGLDLFYEAFYERSYRSGQGTRNPLIQTQAPYVGDTYRVNPGDFAGVGVFLEGVPIVGPTLRSWLTRRDPGGGSGFPPLLTVGVGYVFTLIQQTDFKSNSKLWDWTQERPWRPGYKHRLILDVQISFLRLGAPFMLYLSLKNLSWIPGKNMRPADVFQVGIRAPLKFW